MGTKAIDHQILQVLSSGEIDGNVFRITAGQLDPKLYEGVNQVLEALGGQWNRRIRGHVFESDPTDPLDRVITAGEIGPANPFEFFETPDWLADRMAKLAGIGNTTDNVLEPSAGNGALILAMRRAGFIESLTAVELDPARAERLARMFRVNVRAMDFLDFQPVGKFDRVLMNPPFSRGQDVGHIVRAYSMLAPGGILVSIASAGVSFRQERKYQEFRHLLQACGHMVPNPEGAFKVSGTSVRTVTITLTRPSEGDRA